MFYDILYGFVGDIYYILFCEVEVGEEMGYTGAKGGFEQCRRESEKNEAKCMIIVVEYCGFRAKNHEGKFPWGIV